VSALVNSLKSVSARRIRAKFTRAREPAQHARQFWSPSYPAASCGGSPLSIFRHYIEQQQLARP
jgi:putative transposase